MQHKMRWFAASSSLIALFAGVHPAKAAGDEATRLQEVVVTAERRAENIMTVPIQVNAITSEQLRQAGVVGLKDVIQLSPGLSFGSNTTQSPLGISFMVRGISAVTNAQNVDPAVGVYLDGMYVARTEGLSSAVVDIRQIEILEGPQGTLFGRNTLAGAVTIETNKPRLNEFSGLVKGTVGNLGTYGGQVVANIPLLHDKLAVRLVYDRTQHGGYQPDPTLGHNVYSLKNDYFRIGIRYDPVENLTFTEMADWSFYRGSARTQSNYALDPTLPPSTASTVFSPIPASVAIPASIRPYGDNTTFSEFDPRQKGRTFNTITTAVWSHPWATFKSITAYRNFNFRSPFDADGSAGRFVEFPNENTSQWQFSQELQAYGDTLGGKLSWIGGLYFFEEHIGGDAGSGDPGYYFQANRLLWTHFIDGLNISKSAYLQLTYKVVPNVRVRAGARYTWDSRKLAYEQRAVANYWTAPTEGCFSPFTNAGGVTLSNGQTLPGLQSGFNSATGLGLDGGMPCIYRPHGVRFHYIPWTAGIDWQATPAIFLYASVSKGYHSGGFQQTAVADIIDTLNFDPESAINYEVGVKADLFDRRLRLTASAYRMDYKDMQLNVQRISNAGAPFNTVTNAANARLQGVQFSATAHIERLTLRASAALADDKFVRTSRNGGIVTQTGALGAARFNSNSLVDNGVPFYMGYSPAKRSFGFSADYDFDTPWGTLTPHADYSWQSKRTNAPPLSFVVVNGVSQAICIPCGQAGAAQQALYNLQNVPSVGILNLRLTLNVKDAWRVEAFGRNVTNKVYATRTLRLGVGAVSAIYSDPRVYGVSLTRMF